MITDIQKALSDLNSCQEYSSLSSSDSEADTLEKKNDYATANEKKREKKRKRKLLLTPGKEQFLKKTNRQSSPK